MPALSGLSSVQGIGTGVGRARCLWYAGNGPFSRARQHVLVLLSAAHRIATNQTSHRGHLPALVPAAGGSHPVAARMRVRPSPHRKRRQRPLHHRHAEESCADLLSSGASNNRSARDRTAATFLPSFCANHWLVQLSRTRLVRRVDVLSWTGGHSARYSGASYGISSLRRGARLTRRRRCRADLRPPTRRRISRCPRSAGRTGQLPAVVTARNASR